MERELNFGAFFRKLRLEKGETLRRFAAKNGIDPGNLSKLERGRLPAPQSQDKLSRYARALGLEEGEERWEQFFTLAALSRQDIPPALLEDEEVAARLPLLLRTLGNERFSGEEIDDLIELIRRN